MAVEDDLAGVGRANNFAGLGLTEFTIRGFNTGEYYRNGFPINRGYPPSPDVVSIERIEVLKGPSAFLYGRGDPGGTFNIVTKQPLAERALAIGTQFGSFNQKRSTFDATGALDEQGRVLARITGAVEDNGSFRDFVHGDRFYLAPVIAWLGRLRHPQLFAIAAALSPEERDRLGREAGLDLLYSALEAGINSYRLETADPVAA